MTELKAYYACNANHARTLARQDGDPVSLSIAARGMCHRELSRLGDALIRVRAASTADSLLSFARKVVLERNAAVIVRRAR